MLWLEWGMDRRQKTRSRVNKEAIATGKETHYISAQKLGLEYSSGEIVIIGFHRQVTTWAGQGRNRCQSANNHALPYKTMQSQLSLPPLRSFSQPDGLQEESSWKIQNSCPSYQIFHLAEIDPDSSIVTSKAAVPGDLDSLPISR